MAVLLRGTIAGLSTTCPMSPVKRNSYSELWELPQILGFYLSKQNIFLYFTWSLL